jgi:hypothetical protein
MSAATQKLKSLASFLFSLTRDNDYVYGDISSESANVKAEEEHLEVVLPRPNQLFIDIDNDFAMAIFERNLPSFYRWYACVGSEVIRPSKSGGERKHITITLADDIDPKERLILQAYLGSDLKREFLGLQRIKQGDPHPTLFLEKKKNSFLSAGIKGKGGTK